MSLSLRAGCPTAAARRGVAGQFRQHAVPRPQHRLVAVQAAEPAPAGDSDKVPFGCSRYTVRLRKPLGIVLEQDSKNGNIYVVEIKPTGSAAQEGSISQGDQLIATSGVVYNGEADYGGATVKQGQQLVRLMVVGESFKTVSAAIGSHPGHIPVTLEFQRCDPFGTGYNSE